MGFLRGINLGKDSLKTGFLCSPLEHRLGRPNFLQKRQYARYRPNVTQRFAKGGKERKLNIRPIKLNAQAFFAFERRRTTRTVATAVLQSSKTRLFSALLTEHDASLAQWLSLPGPFTVFAPINSAMEKLSTASLDQLKSKRQAGNFVHSHVVKGFWLLRDIVGHNYTPWFRQNSVRESAKILYPLSGKAFSVTICGSLKEQSRCVYLGNASHAKTKPAKIVAADIRCHNGVIHLVDNTIISNVRKKSANKLNLVPSNR